MAVGRPPGAPNPSEPVRPAGADASPRSSDAHPGVVRRWRRPPRPQAPDALPAASQALSEGGDGLLDDWDGEWVQPLPAEPRLAEWRPWRGRRMGGRTRTLFLRDVVASVLEGRADLLAWAEVRGGSPHDLIRAVEKKAQWLGACRRDVLLDRTRQARAALWAASRRRRRVA